MKKLLLTAAVMLFFLEKPFAQFNITSAHNPQAGQSYQAYSLTGNTDEGNGGANQTWDFSGSTKTFMANTAYLNPVSTPYASDFTNANLAANSGSGSYSYYIADNNKLEIVGVASSQTQQGITSTTIMKYSDKQTYLTYPLTYNTEQSDKFSATGTATAAGQVINLTRVGNDTVLMDGYGKLILPGGAELNAVRVKVIQNYKDSMIYMGMKMHYATTRFETYNFYAENNSHPVVAVTTTTIGGNSSKVVIYYEDVATSINNALNTENFEMFPCPAKSNIALSYTLDQASSVKLAIKDQSGRLIKEVMNEARAAGGHKEVIELGLQPGMYMLEIQQGDAIGFKKLIVE